MDNGKILAVLPVKVIPSSVWYLGGTRFLYNGQPIHGDWPEKVCMCKIIKKGDFKDLKVANTTVLSFEFTDFEKEIEIKEPKIFFIKQISEYSKIFFAGTTHFMVDLRNISVSYMISIVEPGTLMIEHVPGEDKTVIYNPELDKKIVASSFLDLFSMSSESYPFFLPAHAGYLEISGDEYRRLGRNLVILNYGAEYHIRAGKHLYVVLDGELKEVLE